MVDLPSQVMQNRHGSLLGHAGFRNRGRFVLAHANASQGAVPQLENAELDLDELGVRLAQRKQELMDEIALADLDELIPQDGDRTQRGEVRAR